MSLIRPVCLLLPLALIFTGPSQAADTAPPSTLTRSFHGTALKDALATLFADRPETVLVLPEVALNPVNIRMEGVSAQSALDQVLRSARAELRWEKGVAVARASRSPYEPKALAEVTRDGERLSLRLEHYPLGRLPQLLQKHFPSRVFSPVPTQLAGRLVTAAPGGTEPVELLREVARAAEVSLEVTDNRIGLAPLTPVRRVQTLHTGILDADFRQAPLREAYAALLPPGTPLRVTDEVADTPITFRVRADRDTLLEFVTRLVQVAQPRLDARMETSGYLVFLRAPGSGGPNGPRLSAELRQVPLRQALTAILKPAGIPYSIEPAVPDVPITARFQEMELPNIMRVLARLAASVRPGVTVRRDGRVWVFAMHRVPVVE